MKYHIHISVLSFFMTLGFTGRMHAQRLLINPAIISAQDDTIRHHSSSVTPIHLSTQQIESLTLLGKVWGFVKYYHPAVASGQVEADTELLRLLPQVLATHRRAEINQILSAWLTSLGPVPTCTTCNNRPSTNSFRQQADFAWLTDTKQLSPTLRKQLDHLRQNRYQGPQHYVTVSSNDGVPAFLHEDAYAATDYPVTELRVLALFRYWNIVQYFYPYKYLLDQPWTDQLVAFLPRFVAANDALAYRLVIQELACRLSDAHCAVSYTDAYLNRYWGLYDVPVKMQFVNREAVVANVQLFPLLPQSLLQRGDIITQVDGVPMATLLQERGKLAPAPNEPRQLRDIAKRLLWGNSPEVQVQVLREGQPLTLQLPRLLRTKLDRYASFAPRDSSYRLLTPSIGYLHLGRLKKAQLPAIRQHLWHTKGMVVDMRAYPSGELREPLTALFQDQPRPFVRETGPDLSYPGREKWLPTLFAKPGAEPPYAGKVILLVNEYTQSNAEFIALALRTTPHALVMGSTTAGTDGDVVFFDLPGGVHTQITTLGEYYPDDRDTQRVGVQIDVVVQPTVAGIKAGRDEVLGKAIQFIESMRPTG